ncbi:hypothetical protein LJC15_00080 [Desulfovibrio sp. OttesenSCG-928-G11]|nr:hypothetical protein [Desulfovibrio sp. OttesenSCG-928-G11]
MTQDSGQVKNISEMSFIDLPDLTRDEKREIWLKRSGNTVVGLASVAGVSVPTLSRRLRDEAMPIDMHKLLTDYGVPLEVLPPADDAKRGPRFRSPRSLN